jgi:hypothetical protein
MLRTKFDLSENTSIGNNLAFNYRKTDTDTYFNRELYKLLFGIMTNIESHMLMFNIMSNSNKPFYSIDEINILGEYAYTFWKDDTSSFGAGIAYTKNRTFLRHIPLPFFYYTYKNDSIMLNLGMPFIIRWKIFDKLTYKVRYFPIINLETELKYSFYPFFSIGTFFEWKQENYMIAHRVNTDEFLFYEYKTAGLKLSIFLVYANVGYCLSPSHYRGEAFNDKGNKTGFENSIIYSAGLFMFF